MRSGSTGTGTPYRRASPARPAGRTPTATPDRGRTAGAGQVAWPVVGRSPSRWVCRAASSWSSPVRGSASTDDGAKRDFNDPGHRLGGRCEPGIGAPLPEFKQIVYSLTTNERGADH